MTGSSSPVTQRPLPQDDPRRRKPDITRAQALLGWQPVVSLEEGLKATIPYFAYQLRQSEQALHFGRHPQARATLAAAE
jgi:UDP-glucuronate decarboxylase